MDKKSKKKTHVLQQRIQALRQQLAGARKQMDDPAELKLLEQQLATAEAELAQDQGRLVRVPRSSCRRETLRRCNGGEIPGGKDFWEESLAAATLPIARFAASETFPIVEGVSALRVVACAAPTFVAISPDFLEFIFD